MFIPILLVSPPRPSPLPSPYVIVLCLPWLNNTIERKFPQNICSVSDFFFFDVLESGHGDVAFVAKCHRSLVSFLGTHCYCSLLYEQSQCSNGCRLIVPPSDYCDALIFKNSFLEKVGPSTETQGLWVDLKSYQASSKRSQSFWLLIGARKSLYFSAQSEWSML